MLIRLFLLLSLLGLSSCAFLLEERTHQRVMDKETDGFWVADRDFPVVPGDSGRAFRSTREIKDRTPASFGTMKEQREAKSLDDELVEKEQKLSEAEYRKYLDDEDFLKNTSERIYYLSLSPYEREDYINSRRLNFYRSQQIDQDYKNSRLSLVENRRNMRGEIYVGMNKNQIVQTWGQPERVDVAGNPRNENERWSFYENGRIKHVFFENGQVQGWSLD